MRVLFVCMGNICRSPTAEAVLRHLAAQAGWGDRLQVDSAGTGSWHVGEPPDPRAVAAAAARGIRLTGAARQVRASDLERFDLVLALDRSNLSDLRRLARGTTGGARLGLLREYDPAAVAAGTLDVPDPYYGAEGGFDEVLDIVEAACRGLLADLAAES
jgi:protein-tyrosine phosphatase